MLGAPEKTHREVKKPQMDVRFLADYMAAQGRERARRSIVQGCRYQKLARLYNHKEAKATILPYFSSGGSDDMASLEHKAFSLRDRIADSQYERNLYDYNADYLDAFRGGYSETNMPKAELLPAQPIPKATISGVTLTFETFARFQRVMQGSNRVRNGALMLRYKKGEALPQDIGEWQSAILFGFMRKYGNYGDVEPEQKLCVTLDVVSGFAHIAPTDSVNRFAEAEAACATIAEAWANMTPPNGAVL